MDHEERWNAEREIELPEVLHSFVCCLSRLNAGLHLAGCFMGGTQRAGGGAKRWGMCLGGYVIEWVCGVG